MSTDQEQPKNEASRDMPLTEQLALSIIGNASALAFTIRKLERQLKEGERRALERKKALQAMTDRYLEAKRKLEGQAHEHTPKTFYDAIPFWARWHRRADEFPPVSVGREFSMPKQPDSPIPAGVYYNKAHDCFYDETTKAGMGADFWKRWWPAAHRFPQG